LTFQGGFTLSACIIADIQASQRASICLRGAWIQRKKQPRTEAENRGDPAKVRAHLVRNDLPYIGSNPRHCTQFTEYLVSAATEQRIRSGSKVGWSGSTLVQPDRAVSPDRQEADGVSADRERRSLGNERQPGRVAGERRSDVFWQMEWAPRRKHAQPGDDGSAGGLPSSTPRRGV
jgi:hypothetical protein